MENYRLLSLEPVEQFILASDSTPIAICDSVELAMEWVFQHDPLHIDGTWVHILENNSQPEKWISINKVGKLWTIYSTEKIV